MRNFALFDVLGFLARLRGRVACLFGFHDWIRTERAIFGFTVAMARCQRCEMAESLIRRRRMVPNCSGGVA